MNNFLLFSPLYFTSIFVSISMYVCLYLFCMYNSFFFSLHFALHPSFYLFLCKYLSPLYACLFAQISPSVSSSICISMHSSIYSHVSISLSLLPRPYSPFHSCSFRPLLSSSSYSVPLSFSFFFPPLCMPGDSLPSHVFVADSHFFSPRAFRLAPPPLSAPVRKEGTCD